MELFGARLQFEAAMNYYKGNPVQGYEQDKKKAFFLFEEAANAGFVEAMYQAGMMVYSGDGVAKNCSCAYDWFLKAARKNHLESQKMCGKMLLRGEGIPKNLNESFKWYERAALQNDQEAILQTANYYHRYKADYQKAIDWYKKAIVVGDGDSFKGLGDVYSELALLQDHNMYDPYSKDDYEENAQHWYKQALLAYDEEATLGSWRAKVCLGEMYLKGKGTSINYEKAKQCFETIIAQKNGKSSGDCSKRWQDRAYFFLAKMYENGLGVEKDIEKSLLYKKQSNVSDKFYHHYHL